MSLIETLSGIDGTRQAIVAPAGRYKYSDLVYQARALALGFEGARVVINCSGLGPAVVALAACDGSADSVAFVSPRVAPDVAVSLMSVVDPHGVLTDRADSLCAADLMVPTESTPALLARKIGGVGRGERGPTRWILTTSGTTSKPKLVEHCLTSLSRTARCDTDKGRGQVWGLLYDYTRFAGLQVVLQSLLSGACLAVPEQDAELETQLAFLAEAGCTHLSATPTMWRMMLMTSSGPALKLRQVTLGGEIVDDAVLASLARAFPDARISHIYASTEAGVGLSVTDGRAGFPSSYLTTPPLGIGLRIEQGRLWVRNSDVTPTYLGASAAFGQYGWVDTGDFVEQSGDRVYFKGRESGVINVGGNKVHPEEIERAILEYPDVLMARAYARPNPIMGALVTADIVPGPEASDTLIRDLRKYLRTRLEKHMIPVSFRTTETFDLNSAGKIRRDR